jgi:hypothetical protein
VYAQPALFDDAKDFRQAAFDRIVEFQRATGVKAAGDD